MSFIKPVTIVAVAITGVVMTSHASVAQHCSSCGDASFGRYPTASVVSDCNGPGCRLHSNHRLGNGARKQEFKARHAHAKAIHAKAAARNNAWPKPFNCADRQLYHSYWRPMIDKGYEEQCVLTADHFDPETNELNRFGQHAVASIMQNMPSHRKKVFLHRGETQQVNDARYASVEQTINTFFSHTGPARIAFSVEQPVTTSGGKVEAIFNLATEAIAPPVIPISIGEGISDSIGN